MVFFRVREKENVFALGEEPGAEQKWGGTGGDAYGSKGGVGTCRSLGKWWRQGGQQLLCLWQERRQRELLEKQR